MTDLHKITEPFGLLPEATQEALRAHFYLGGKVELYGIWGWSVCDDPTWTGRVVYRAAYEPVIANVRKVMWCDANGAILAFEALLGMRMVIVTYDEIDGKIDLSTYRVEEAGE